MNNEIIKTCPYCQAPLTLDELANNPDLKLIGMSFADDSIERAYYFYQHEVPNCGTSLMVPVDKFASLICEPIPSEKMALRECCEEHCVNIEDLSACGNDCYFAPFRKLLLNMMETKSRQQTNSTTSSSAIS